MYICIFLGQMLPPYKFHGRDMSGILFFNFASCELLTLVRSFRPGADQKQAVKGKIAPGTFKLTFPLNLAGKNRTFYLPGGRGRFQSWEVGRGWCNPVILKIDYFENISGDMHSKLCLQVRSFILYQPYLAKHPTKNRMFLWFFYVKIHFAHILYTQNDNFSIFEGMLTL